MASNTLYRVTNPATGTTYISPFYVIPNNATTVTVELNTFNASNVLTAVSNATVIIRNITSSSNVVSNNGGTAFNVIEGPFSNAAFNGSNVIAVAATIGSSLPAGGYLTIQITAFTGTALAAARVRRSGAWTFAASINVRRSSAWTTAASSDARRSGVWTPPS